MMTELKEFSVVSEDLSSGPSKKTDSDGLIVGSASRSASSTRRVQQDFRGLIGLVNIGNSCYMNSSIQSLSNCPPFRQYLIECLPAQPSSNLVAALSLVFRKMWTSERNPGSLSPRPISSSMKQRMFRSWQQQDAQEFLRCLFSQVHDEIGVPLPQYYHNYTPKPDLRQEESLELHKSSSSSSDASMAELITTQGNLRSQSMSSYDHGVSPIKPKSSVSLPNSPSVKPKISTKGLYTQLSDSLNKGKAAHNSNNLGSGNSSAENEGSPFTAASIIVVDTTSGQANVHKTIDSYESAVDGPSRRDGSDDGRHAKQRAQQHVSIVTQVFQGELESRVECLQCAKVSITREPFQDLSLPIPSRKDLTKLRKTDTDDDVSSSVSSRVCRVWNIFVGFTRDMVMGPPTSLNDCLEAFFDSSDLSGENRYLCQYCNSLQNSRKEMSILHLPEILCVHLKRFRYDGFFTSKVSRYIDFPMTDLNMAPYMKLKEQDVSMCQYQLISVINHIGGAGGGHYICYAKNPELNQWYEYNDAHVSSVSVDDVHGTEGYLLFYQKQSQQPVLPMKIADIVPKPGTSIPSDDVCYISRHWLLLRNTCVNPGPVIPYDFVCEHGDILPGKESLAKTLALPIQKSIWEQLVERYGGGPLVTRLETCQECQAHLLELKQRRKEEADKVTEIQTTNKGKPETLLLSRSWLKMWQDFIHCESLAILPPGPIDNSSLLVTNDQVIKLNNKQYRPITLPVWKYLHDKYGGGPLVCTSKEILTDLLQN